VKPQVPRVFQRQSNPGLDGHPPGFPLDSQDITGHGPKGPNYRRFPSREALRSDKIHGHLSTPLASQMLASHAIQMRAKSAIVLILFVALNSIWSCSKPPPFGDKIKVAASIFPLADIVRNVGGDLVEVEVLIPPGASPHVFEPTPEAFRKFAQTRLFVMVGAGLEFWAQKLITATAGEDLVVVRAIDGVHLLRVDENHPALQKHQAEDREVPHEGDEHQGSNPHVWLDPLVAESLAQRIALALIELSPEHAQDLRQRLDRYLEKLNDLDETIRETVRQFPNKEFVAFHPAWSYFARRYGLVEVAVIQQSPGREPTPKDLQKIIQAIEDYGIKAVFAEPQLNPSAASAIASEAGVKVLFLDPLGGPDLLGRDSYIGLMDYNLEIMREAML